MGLRERKKQETRTALAWAAVRLIVERGYDRVLVEDIATAAGVSPRTFNNYFASKAEAVASRELDRLLRVADGLRARPPGESLWDAVTQAMTVEVGPGPEIDANPITDRVAWRAGVSRMLAVPAVQAEMLRASATAESALAAAVGDRTGTDPAIDLYPDLVAASVLAALSTARRHFTRGGREQLTDMQALLTDALGRIAAGLPPPCRSKPS
jgi:AcrR family transcriptional regulator